MNRKREKTARRLSSADGTADGTANGANGGKQSSVSGALSGGEVGKRGSLSAEDAEKFDNIDLLDIDDAGVLADHNIEIHASLDDDEPPQEKKPKQQKVKPSKKKGKKTETKKKSTKKKDEVDQNDSKKDKSDHHRRAKLLKLAIEDAKEEFEQEKETVLSKVPSSIKKMFGQIGFARWGKNHLPALIMSPYAVPPGPARQIWMDMFGKVG